MATADDLLESGTIVAGKLRIERTLGRGGMGVVYEAQHLALHQRVAVKVLAAHHALDDAVVTRFLNEARAVARIRSQHVARVLDADRLDDGRPYLVMELCEGMDLAEHLRRHGRSGVEEACDLVVQALEGIARAHAAGLVHRDLKPSNLFLARDGGATCVKILDFGVAKIAAADEEQPAGRSTAAGTLLGSPAYAAPEQLRGAKDVDARADVWSLGVILYELTTGALPFTGGSVAEVIAAALTREPAPLRARRPEIPASFEAVVMRCLAKPRERRFADVADLADALAPHASEEGRRAASRVREALGAARAAPDAEPPPASEPPIDTHVTQIVTSQAGSTRSVAEPPPRPRRRRAWLVLAGVGVAAIGAVVAVRLATRAPASPVAAPPKTAFELRDVHRVTFGQGCEEFPSFTQDGRSLVFDVKAGNDQHVVLHDLATSAERTITTEAGWQMAPAVSPDGRTVAYAARAGNETGAWVVPLDGSAPPRKISSGQVSPSWSPDGRALWAGGDTTSQRFDLATGAVTGEVAAPEGYEITTLVELADGRIFARLYNTETRLADRIVRYARAGAPAEVIVRDPVEDVLAATPDGDALLVTRVQPTTQSELWRYPLDGSAPSLFLAGAVQAIKRVAFSPKGDRMAWSDCSADTMLSVLRSAADAAALEATPLFPKTLWADLSPVPIPGTTKMVVISDRDGAERPWVLDVTSMEPPRVIDVGDVTAENPAISPDARLLAFVAEGKGLRLVPLDGASAPEVLTDGHDDVWPTFARDGRHLYFQTTADGHPVVARISLDPPHARTVVVEHALRPNASRTDDRVAYLAGDDRHESEPRLLDTKTGASTAIGGGLPRGLYPQVIFSPDGRRLAIVEGISSVVERDARTGVVLRRFASPDVLMGLAYSGADPIVATYVFRGDVWIGDVVR